MEEEEVFVDYKNAIIIMCMMVVRGLDDVLEDAARFTFFAWTSVILAFRSCAQPCVTGDGILSPFWVYQEPCQDKERRCKFLFCELLCLYSVFGKLFPSPDRLMWSSRARLVH